MAEQPRLDSRLSIGRRKIRGQSATDYQDTDVAADVLEQIVAISDGLQIVVVVQGMIWPLEFDQQIVAIEVFVQQKVGTLVGHAADIGLAEHILNLPFERCVGTEQGKLRAKYPQIAFERPMHEQFGRRRITAQFFKLIQKLLSSRSLRNENCHLGKPEVV